MSDQELLRDYTEAGSTSAFCEIVTRHADLVYSVAWRITRSTQTAEDVAQSVFLDLARNARGIRPGTPLGAWLHVVAHRTAVDTVRREVRRVAREKSIGSIAATTSESVPWSELEPVVDEALETLSEVDRTAILLRYFEAKSLREVGLVLGLTDDAAQKRIARALERMREHMVRRGLPTTTAALAADLGAHAILKAPPAMLALILQAIQSIVPGGLMAIRATAATSVLQKIALGTALLAFSTVGIYVSFLFWQGRQSHNPDVKVSIAQPFKAAEAVVDVPSLAANVAPGGAGDGTRWTPIQRVELLRKLSTELPAQHIPELRLLTPMEWMKVAEGHVLDTATDIRVALAELRAIARTRMASLLQDALKRFMTSTNGRIPDDVAALLPYFGGLVDSEMLARYYFLEGEEARNPEEKIMREKATSDMILSVGLDTSSMKNNADFPPAFGESEIDALERGWMALGAAYGKEATEMLATMVSPRQMEALMAQGIQRVASIYGDDEAVGNAMKESVRSFLDSNPGTEITDMAQILPHLRDADKMIAMLRPVFAQMEYMQENQGRSPPDGAALEPYLRRPFDAASAFRSLKLKWDGQSLSLNWSYGMSAP